MIGEYMKNKILNIIKIAVIIELLVVLLNFNLTTIFLSLFTLFLLFLTDYIKKKLEIPYKLQLLIYIFIIGTEVLGEIHNLYNKVWYYDDIMHTLSSFIVAALSIYILNKITKDNNKKLVVVFSFILPMAVAAIWEITEFTIDNVFNKDMQKDTIVNNITSTLFSPDKNKAVKKEINSLYINNIDFIQEYGGYIDIGLYDTMEDMICALLGALLFIIKKLAEP